MNTTPQISIVIVNYNVMELLLHCLKSIYSEINNSLIIETIVIDNDSKDGSVDAVRKYYPQVIITENNFNAGFASANNQGMTVAKGEFIFLLNPDTEIVGDALFKLRDYLNKTKTCVIVAPQLLNSDKSVQISVWKNHTTADLIIETFYFHKIFSLIDFPAQKLKTTFESKTLSGAALFFKRELIDVIGMFDEQFFWMDDIDFCYRAQKRGSLIYLHSAQVFHHSGQSQKKNYNVAIANQLLSKLKYYRKHSIYLSFALANLSCFIFIITRLIVFSVLSPLKQLYKLKAKAYFYSLKRYLKYLFLNDKNIV